MKTSLRIAAQAFAIVLGSALIAIGTNALRGDGIPLIADIEYEIFAPCKDSEAQSAAVSGEDLAGANDGEVMYVDARPKEAFAIEHVEGAVNVPYSVLFGADPAALKSLEKKIVESKPDSVIVYGVYADRADPEAKVDFAEPLAQQLVDSNIEGVKHLEGGMEELKKNGVKTVKGTEGEIE